MVRYACVLACLLFVAGCSQSANTGGEAAVTEVSFNTAGAPTVEISVPDMMCPDSCAVAAREVLSAQPGVKEVLVDFDTKRATVAVDTESFDSAAALAALADRGFVHSEVKSRDAKAPVEDAAPAATTEAAPAG
jgi:copper chaperone CopZ